MIITLLLAFASGFVVGEIGREVLVYFRRHHDLRRRARFFLGGRR